MKKFKSIQEFSNSKKIEKLSLSNNVFGTGKTTLTCGSVILTGDGVLDCEWATKDKDDETLIALVY